jgi:hypothetical protein
MEKYPGALFKKAACTFEKWHHADFHVLPLISGEKCHGGTFQKNWIFPTTAPAGNLPKLRFDFEPASVSGPG